MDEESLKMEMFDAATSGSALRLAFLLKMGGNPNAKGVSDTLLSAAAQLGHTDCVNLLIDNGADVNMGDDRGRTALFKASASGFDICAERLLKAGALTETPDEHGWTALMAAALNGHEKCLRSLLAHGANMEARNIDSLTSLMWAASKGNLSCVRTLLDFGADITAEDSAGCTVMDWAKDGNHEELPSFITEYLKAREEKRVLEREGESGSRKARKKI